MESSQASAWEWSVMFLSMKTIVSRISNGSALLGSRYCNCISKDTYLGPFFITVVADSERAILISKLWSSLVEGGEGSYLPNCQTNLVIALTTWADTSFHIP